ncbi:hypothetical protein JCM10207_007258 [Rhodosporidiobolus poonsookiae]
MDSDSDSYDVSSALLGGSTSNKSKTARTRTPAASTSSARPSASAAAADDAASDGSGDEEDALFASLASLQHSRNLAEGAALVRKGKDNKQQKQLTGGGSFQALGLPPALLKTLLQRGFTTPTPIQRLALPSILGSTETVTTEKGKKVTVARDHLCMARTGSGKTLCYLLPLLSQLWTHSDKFGARGLILVPTRELALQVLKVGKDLARGIKGEGESLRWAMIVGGEAMEAQYELIAGNPDVIIATPGRFLHLLVEMNYSLSSVESLIIDEADRLFELGFAEQLHEILHRLPAARQTLLFSATLPSSLVGFAKAGLQNPKLIRLDVDQKISKDLQMAYLSVKPIEKEAVLLGLLREVIQVPVLTEEQRAAERARVAAENQAVMDGTDAGHGGGGHGGGGKRGGKSGRGRGGRNDRGTKRKRGGEDGPDADGEGEGGAPVNARQTVVFVSTKHHVEYLTALLTAAHYSVSPIYGSMDQTARKISLSRFRNGHTAILVVTDLAARGIDVPGVEYVINYDFPNGTRAFVHRVGRTARAGRTGWAYTFVTPPEMPYLLDLALFLTRPLRVTPLPADAPEPDYAQNLVLGPPPRSLIETDLETHRALLEHQHQLEILQGVAAKGQRMYERGLSKASPESYRRAKEMVRAKEEKLGPGAAAVGEIGEEHPIFDEWLARTHGAAPVASSSSSTSSVTLAASPTLASAPAPRPVDLKEQVAKAKEAEGARLSLLAKLTGFRPPETVFEVQAKGKNHSKEGTIAGLMQDRRKALLRSARARELVREVEEDELPAVPEGKEGADEWAGVEELEVEKPHEVKAGMMDDADEEELEAVFGKKPAKRSRALDADEGAGRKSYRDERFYMGYEQEGAATEAGYALTNGDSFVAQAAHSTYDIAGTRGDTEGTAPDGLLQRASTLKWDRKQKKFVRADQVGADNKKMIRGESGQRLPASFKSGSFDEWRKKTRTSVPRVGDAEIAGRAIKGGKHFRHQGGTPKADRAEGDAGGKGKHAKRRVGAPGKPGSLPGGLKGAAEIRKDRIQKEKRTKRSNMYSAKNTGGFRKDGGTGPKAGGGGGKGGKKSGGGRRK